MLFFISDTLTLLTKPNVNSCYCRRSGVGMHCGSSWHSSARNFFAWIARRITRPLTPSSGCFKRVLSVVIRSRQQCAEESNKLTILPHSDLEELHYHNTVITMSTNRLFFEFQLQSPGYHFNGWDSIPLCQKGSPLKDIPQDTTN